MHKKPYNNNKRGYRHIHLISIEMLIITLHKQSIVDFTNTLIKGHTTDFSPGIANWGVSGPLRINDNFFRWFSRFPVYGTVIVVKICERIETASSC